jgi:ABC-type bacteriocin/lantibiotic exporter with double-glycine peptidase domain
MAIMYNTPVLIAFGVAAFANDLGLAVFIAMNEWTIQRMVNGVVAITENKSEIDGLYKVLEPLKGDDTSIEEKPSMPEYIILNDVKFTYPNSNLKFSIPELRIDKGKRYRFSGPSGSGKSTFFRYFAGEIEGNKRFNIRTFYIHQRSELLYDTVRNNITLGNQYVPDPIIIELINDAKLDKWFESLPNGLDTIIGRDTEPSGGEASRISLLRLFIHIRNYTRDGSKPNKDDIIILDEVTSALDKRDVFIKDDELSTEESVIKLIDRETKGCTMFVISHEDVTTSAYGFKDIIDQQLVIDIEGNDRVLRKL